MTILMLWQVIDTNQAPTTTSYYWAENRKQALDNHLFQTYLSEDPVDIENITIDRVWASNNNMKYRGYVAKEIK